MGYGCCELCYCWLWSDFRTVEMGLVCPTRMLPAHAKTAPRSIVACLASVASNASPLCLFTPKIIPHGTCIPLVNYTPNAYDFSRKRLFSTLPSLGTLGATIIHCVPSAQTSSSFAYVPGLVPLNLDVSLNTGYFHISHHLLHLSLRHASAFKPLTRENARSLPGSVIPRKLCVPSLCKWL